MILAIRALRATIFAFNASIWVSRPALASVTEEEAEISLPRAAAAAPVPIVPLIENAPPDTGAKNVYVFTPDLVSTAAAVGSDPCVPFDEVRPVEPNRFAEPSAIGLPDASVAVRVNVPLSPGA